MYWAPCMPGSMLGKHINSIFKTATSSFIIPVLKIRKLKLKEVRVWDAQFRCALKPSFSVNTTTKSFFWYYMYKWHCMWIILTLVSQCWGSYSTCYISQTASIAIWKSFLHLKKPQSLSFSSKSLVLLLHNPSWPCSQPHSYWFPTITRWQ